MQREDFFALPGVAHWIQRKRRRKFLAKRRGVPLKCAVFAARCPSVTLAKRKEFHMSSAVLMERFSVGSQTSGGQAQSWQPSGFPGAGPSGNWCVVPRCKVEFEKCTGGFKIHCRCEDELSCATLQNLCRMMCDGCCSCCCTQNGIQCCQCTFANCHCKCEYTADGCCISCTSGDKQCCSTLQACCDCCAKCCDSGCCCYVCFNGTPVCCGTC
jgi:hypothetical protein